ncbi:MAG: phosphatase [Bacteroidetes bacterium CHB5]|nr:phosphatase [Bacteroidetes bacterium CHB5]
MKLAAIDIGSNAIRFQVSSVLESKDQALFKKMEYVRFPLRLGHDVFTTNRISDKSIVKFKKLMHAFKLLLDLYEVDDYMLCATSAMRESENGQALADEIKKEFGLTIEIIGGQREAELINTAIRSYLSNQAYLHIDVGGGSTELNIYFGGKKIKTRSFKVGSVRILENHDTPAVWSDMEYWIKENIKPEMGKVTAVGTGGNISKIYELAQLKPHRLMSLKRMGEVKEMVAKHSIEERIYKLQMNPDRADVIVPASSIYMRAMEWAKAKYIFVPEVGLKDGMMLHLFERNSKQTKVEFINKEDQSKGNKTQVIGKRS